ncbi:unnamed protein product [Rotaria sordida]|uniref:G-protein coupled receptors family 1 profile domain-containing protein n=1 Tax=Rotaria sordida TaxID=392033 RepID=A0A815ZUJ5_9BILA|nr:unnamed protein product [Rotaria sordida]CAF1587002.1 unnamed protein product [Rotaria sordida]
MSDDLFNISWFMVFMMVILIAFIANIIIILAILRDKSMHTSTYFYIINVNIADILLIFSCLPERIAAILSANDGFILGMFTCYLLPFLQQVSMHAALGFLLILTVHRCYPAGVPRCLQRNLIRRQIRNHCQTLCLIWAFAILINLPLFAITKYEKNDMVPTENTTNKSQTISIPTCETEAKEIWSRTYLILLLVLTYLITGFFLIIIYGQAIRIILSSKKYTNKNIQTKKNNDENYHFVSRNIINQNKFRETRAHTSTSSSSSSINSSNRRPQQYLTTTLPISMMIPIEKTKCSTNSHSTQHLQVIIMLFVVILLYILLLLPYRLLNLLFIVYNQLFQYNFMNETLFHWLLNTVRLLVFLNCALQPIIYLVISSRLRQTVIKFFQTCSYRYYCRCRCSLSFKNEQRQKTSNRVIQTYSCQRYPNTSSQTNRQQKFNSGDNNLPINNTRMIEYQSSPLTRSQFVTNKLSINKTHQNVKLNNSLRK